MKKYSLYCNMCGRELKEEQGIIREGVLSVEQGWGYFSGKDGEIHSFDLCEHCYDKLTAQFQIPVTVRRQKELL